MPPPGRSAASTTCTRSPAAASRRAPASPLGPAPTTTASGLPFTAPSSPGRAPRLPVQSWASNSSAARKGSVSPATTDAGERAQRRRAVHVAHPLPQGGQRDGLDLARGPLLAAALPLAGGLQPAPVLLDLLEHLVDAVVGLPRGDRLADRRPPVPGLGVPAAEGLHVAQVAHGLVGAVPVGLVDDEHVGDLEDARPWPPGCRRPSRGDQHQRGVGQRGDLQLRLADADGLDQDDVAAGRVEHAQRLRRGPGQPAEVPAGGHRPDVDAAVAGVVLHPHAVAEQRATGERGRRVDGEHADPLAGRAQNARTSAVVVVDLPTPGEPVRPMTWAWPVCGDSAAATSRSAGLASSTSEISRATDRASPSRAPVDQRRDVGRPAPPSPARGVGGRRSGPRFPPSVTLRRARAGSGRRPGRRRRTGRRRRRRRRGGAAPGRGAARSGRRSCRPGGRARWRRR